MKALHVVPEINEANGVYQVARMLAQENGGAVINTRDFLQQNNLNNRTVGQFSEAWVHGMWLPSEWLACRKVIKAGVPLVRMTHGSLSPVYLKCQSPWKKKAVGILWERRMFGHATRIVVTGEHEAQWCRRWGLKNDIQVLDLKRFFALPADIPSGIEIARRANAESRPVHVLYMGMRHPLKGVEYLEEAVEEIRRGDEGKGRRCGVELQIVSNAFGEEKEKVWEWCDVLVLPTLSENFGLVVAEALEHGKRVITTDGAPAWEGQPGVTYLKGYVVAHPTERMRMLRRELVRISSGKGGDDGE